MPLKTELQPWGWSQGVPSMLRNHEKAHNYPQPVKFATLCRANLIILVLQVSSLSLNNFYYIVSDLFFRLHNSLWLRLNYYTPKMRGHRWQWISNKIKIRRPGQLKKSKSWGPILHFMWNPLLPMPPKCWHNNSFLGSVLSSSHQFVLYSIELMIITNSDI